MTNLRRIEPISAWEGMPAKPELGPRPEVRWVAPTDLWIDETYQRDLTRRSYDLIRRAIEEGFCYESMQWPKCVEVDGKLHAVNGQHTAIMAATVGVEKIPVIVDVGRTVEQRAGSFVALNMHRVAMSNLDIYRARLAAKQEDALDVQRVCARAGIRLRNITPAAKILPGDTAAISTISKLVRRRGVVRAREILEAFVLGERGPISAAELDAADAVATMRPGCVPGKLAAVIRAIGERGVIDAQLRARTTHVPVKVTLAEIYKARLDASESATAARRSA